MKIFGNKKEKGTEVKVILKEGEKVYREYLDEESGEIVREEIDLAGKTEETEDEKSEKKSILSKISTPVKVTAAIIGGIAVGAAIGAKNGASKAKMSEVEPAENQEVEENEEAEE